MANIINGSFRKSEPNYIISNEIKFLEKTENVKYDDSNILIVFLSPIIAILVGKFISLFNILGLIFLSIFKNKENFNQIIKSIYENILSPAMNTPETILKQYPEYFNEFMKIVGDYVDVYFYKNLFYFLTLVVAFMFVLVLMKNRNIFKISSFNFIKANVINIFIIFALGFASSLIISFLISTTGNISFAKESNVNNIFKLCLMSLSNIITFAYIHEFLFRGIIPTFFWRKLKFIDKKAERYVFLNIILLISSILFVITIWGANFLLVLNFILMSIFFRILTSIAYNISLNISYLIAFNLIGTFVFGYPILNFKNQFNLIGNTLNDYTIYNGGNFGILGSLFPTILLIILIVASVIFYDLLTQIIKKH